MVCSGRTKSEKRSHENMKNTKDKLFTTSDGVEYYTAADGSRRRLTPKYSSKRDRREQIKARRTEKQETLSRVIEIGKEKLSSKAVA